MKQRVLAIAGAVILVCAAILVRQAIVGDDGSSGDDRPNGDRPIVACTPDLASVCDALADAGAITPAPSTLDLDGSDAPPDDLDGWITWDPAPRVAGFAAGDDRWGVGEPLASAPLALLTTATGLADECGSATATTWDCVVDAARSGTSVGVGDPGTAEGLARHAPVVDAIAEPDGSTDFDDLAAAVAEVDASVLDGQEDAATMARRLVTAPGTVTATVAPQGLAEAEAATAQGRARQVRVVVPTPKSSATVVLATAPGGSPGDAADLCEDAADALERLGLVACRGQTMADDLAGLLYQVYERQG